MVECKQVLKPKKFYDTIKSLQKEDKFKVLDKKEVVELGFPTILDAMKPAIPFADVYSKFYILYDSETNDVLGVASLAPDGFARFFTTKALKEKHALGAVKCLRKILDTYLKNGPKIIYIETAQWYTKGRKLTELCGFKVLKETSSTVLYYKTRK